MKSYLISILTLCAILAFVSISNAQNLSAESLLDNAVSLSDKGDAKGAADALTKGTNALESEAKSSDGDLKSQLLKKTGDLKSLIPTIAGGKASSGLLAKGVSAIKMLLGANRISSLLGKGDSGLLGKASSLTSSLGLVKSGSSILGSGEQGKLNSLIGDATKSVSGLDKSGMAGKLAAKTAAPQLGSIVKLVGSSF